MSKDISSNGGLLPEELAPAPRSWGGLTAILAVVMIYFIALFGSAFLVALMTHLHHWTRAYADYWLKNSVQAQFFYILFDAIIALGLLKGFIALGRFRQARKTLGLLKPHFNDIGYAVAGTVVYFGVYIAAVALAQKYAGLNLGQRQDVGFEAVMSHMDTVLAFLGLVIVPPVLEEIVFRGFLFGGLRKSMRFVPAMLVTSALFALPHLFERQPGESLLWIAGLDTFVLSLVLCALREKTGRLWASMGVHALKNGVAFWILFILK